MQAKQYEGRIGQRVIRLHSDTERDPETGHVIALIGGTAGTIIDVHEPEQAGWSESYTVAWDHALEYHNYGKKFAPVEAHNDWIEDYVRFPYIRLQENAPDPTLQTARA